MKIRSANYEYLINQNLHPSPLKTRGGLNRVTSSDQMEISTTSKVFKGCVEKAKQMTEDRSDRVKELKQQVEAGTYEVSVDSISKALIDHGFFLK